MWFSLIFLIFDVSNKISYDHIPSWIKFITDIDDKGTIVLVGNKIDLEDKREINKDLPEKLCKEKNLDYHEVSAKEGSNIDNMLYKSISGLNILSKALVTKFIIYCIFSLSKFISSSSEF